MNGTCSDAATVTVNYFEQLWPILEQEAMSVTLISSLVQIRALEMECGATQVRVRQPLLRMLPTLMQWQRSRIMEFTSSLGQKTTSDAWMMQVSPSTLISRTTADAGDGGDECDLNFIFNATPSIGAGTWTSSGPGNAFFSDNTSPTATVTVDAYGTYLFTWTEVNGTCVATDQVTVNFYEQPVADPGTGGDECNLNFQFSATVSSGSGTWVQTSGPGTSTFILNSDPTTIVTVSDYGTYEFTWTEVNGTCSDNGTVTVNFYELPVADAGVGGDECDLDFTFSGTASVGNGMWSYTGPGTAAFNSMNDPATDVTVSDYGSYEFTWTEINGSCNSSASVTVNFYDQPVADAGVGGDECDLDFLLSATPSFGNGEWSMIAGPGTASFGNSTSPTSTVAVDTYGTYQFTWTETNGTCVDFGTVTVNFYEQPVADAGLGGDECDLDFVLAANASVGTGTGLMLAQERQPLALLTQLQLRLMLA